VLNFRQNSRDLTFLAAS